MQDTTSAARDRVDRARTLAFARRAGIETPTLDAAIDLRQPGGRPKGPTRLVAPGAIFLIDETQQPSRKRNDSPGSCVPLPPDSSGVRTISSDGIVGSVFAPEQQSRLRRRACRSCRGAHLMAKHRSVRSYTSCRASARTSWKASRYRESRRRHGRNPAQRAHWPGSAPDKMIGHRQRRNPHDKARRTRWFEPVSDADYTKAPPPVLISHFLPHVVGGSTSYGDGGYDEHRLVAHESSVAARTPPQTCCGRKNISSGSAHRQRIDAEVGWPTPTGRHGRPLPKVPEPGFFRGAQSFRPARP